MNALLIIALLPQPLLAGNYFNSEGRSGKRRFHSVTINSPERFHTCFVLGGRSRGPGQLLCRAEGRASEAGLSHRSVPVGFAHQPCHRSA